MGCSKTLSFAGGCVLETCTTEAKAGIGTEVVDYTSLAYSPDLCYAAFLASNAAGTETYVYEYEPATNTAVKKATIPVYALSNTNMVYDPIHQKFVWATGFGAPNTVYLFDPLTDTVTSFASGIASLAAFVYVPQKNRVYGLMGKDGLGRSYVGFLDLDINVVFQLGIIPASGGSTPAPFNLVYVASTDTLYGCWITGLGSALAKFNLTTNTGSHYTATPVVGNQICLNTDTNRLIVHYTPTIVEFDPDTDTPAYTAALPVGATAIADTPYYSSTLKKVFGIAGDLVTGGQCVASYNTVSKATAVVVGGDPAHYYYSVCKFSQGSCFANDYNNATTVDGVRRLCLT